MGDRIRGIETRKVDNLEERKMGGTDLITLRGERGGGDWLREGEGISFLNQY